MYFSVKTTACIGTTQTSFLSWVKTREAFGSKVLGCRLLSDSFRPLNRSQLVRQFCSGKLKGCFKVLSKGLIAHRKHICVTSDGRFLVRLTWLHRITVLLQSYRDRNNSSSLTNYPQKHVYSKQSFVNGSRQTGATYSTQQGAGTCEVISPAYKHGTLWMWHGVMVLSQREERRMHKLTHPDSTGHDNANIPAAGMAEQVATQADILSDFCVS